MRRCISRNPLRLIATDTDGRQLAVLGEVSECAAKQGQVFGVWFRHDLDANYDGLGVKTVIISSSIQPVSKYRRAC